MCPEGGSVCHSLIVLSDEQVRKEDRGRHAWDASDSSGYTWRQATPVYTQTVLHMMILQVYLEVQDQCLLTWCFFWSWWKCLQKYLCKYLFYDWSTSGSTWVLRIIAVLLLVFELFLLWTYFDAPHRAAVVQSRVQFPCVPHIFNVPHIHTMVVVHAGQVFGSRVKGQGQCIGILSTWTGR